MSIIQFHHPLKEHDPNPKAKPLCGYMPWLHLGNAHKKKFVSISGSYVNKLFSVNASHSIGMWIEWEGDTLYQSVRSGGKYNINQRLPCNIHNIINSTFSSIAGFHAVADPYLLSDRYDVPNYFFYGHCRQKNNSCEDNYLSRLNAGDLILFGNLSSGNFVLECVFVVFDANEYTPSKSFTHPSYLPDHYHNYVMGPLRYSTRRHYQYVLYRGVPFSLRNSNGFSGMFSFFPCKDLAHRTLVEHDGWRGFPAISIPLSLFYPYQIRRLRKTGRVPVIVTGHDVSRIWNSIMNCVISQNYKLGISCYFN